MKNSKLILFESSGANFRLSIDTMYEKVKQDGTTQNTIYINKEKETGTFRPSCFLVFTYLTDDFNTTKGIYTTVPHIYRIRQAFEVMHQMLADENSMINVEGVVTVAPNYAEPIVIDNLNLKNNDWISLTLSTYKDENSLATYRGVALQHSKSNGYSSMLTEDEFNTIYDLIMHLDYVSIENQATIIELLSRVGVKSASTGYTPAPAAPRAAAPRTAYSAPAAPRTAPAYQATTPRPATPAAPRANTYVAPQPTNSLPPRPASAPKITMDAVKDIDVEDIDLDDTSMVDNIFNEQ